MRTQHRLAVNEAAGVGTGVDAGAVTHLQTYTPARTAMHPTGEEAMLAPLRTMTVGLPGNQTGTMHRPAGIEGLPHRATPVRRLMRLDRWIILPRYHQIRPPTTADANLRRLRPHLTRLALNLHRQRLTLRVTTTVSHLHPCVMGTDPTQAEAQVLDLVSFDATASLVRRPGQLIDCLF